MPNNSLSDMDDPIEFVRTYAEHIDAPEPETYPEPGTEAGRQYPDVFKAFYRIRYKLHAAGRHLELHSIDRAIHDAYHSQILDEATD